ncbi:class I SAM-dependent methyltransferase [Thermovibrio sp.]
MEVVITTDRRPTPEMIKEARELSERLGAPLVKRRHRTIASIMREFGRPVLVVGKDLNFTLHTLKGQKLFFHPGLFKVRLVNYLSTGRESMVEAMALKEGETVLDCNLGLAQDALMAAFVSKMPVVGLEKEPVIYEIVKRGLETFKPKGKLKVAEFAYKLVKPTLADNYQFLKSQPDKSYDIVYFSPMFVKPKWKDGVMMPFREVAPKDFVSPEVLKEAERVARKRVVIKVNRGVKELFPYLADYSSLPSSTRVEYLYKEVK